MLDRLVQPANASVPILFRQGGKVTEVRLVQPLKAPSIWVTPTGMVTEVNAVQLANVPNRFDTFSEIVTLVNDEQP